MVYITLDLHKNQICLNTIYLHPFFLFLYTEHFIPKVVQMCCINLVRFI